MGGSHELETENSARRKFSRCAENSLGAPKVFRKASHSLGARKILPEREKLSAHKKKCLAALWEGLRRKRAKEPKISRRAKTSLGPRRATKSLGVKKCPKSSLGARFSRCAVRSLGRRKVRSVCAKFPLPIPRQAFPDVDYFAKRKGAPLVFHGQPQIWSVGSFVPGSSFE